MANPTPEQIAWARHFNTPISVEARALEILADALTAAEKRIKSISTMLGWGNVPPLRTLEMGIAALCTRSEQAANFAARIEELEREKAEAAAEERRKCCADKCRWCAQNEPVFFSRRRWAHQPQHYEITCEATEIRERAEREKE